MYLMHHGSTAKNRSRIAGQGVTTSTNKASSSSESSAQAGTYMPEPYISSRMSTDLKADGSSAQRHLCGHQHGDVLMKNSSSPLQSGSPQEQYNPRGAAAYAPGSSRDFNAVDRFAAHDICTPIRPMPSVPRTGRRASPSPVEQHNNNNEEQYQWENSAVASNHETNSHSSGDNGFSLVHMPHNPMVWAYPNQWLNRVTQQGSHPSTTSFHAAASLAPPVRVSPMMAVYSAPSYPSGSESGWCERNERQQHGRC